MYNTTALSTVNWKYPEIHGDSTVTHCSRICVSLQLGKVTIHRTHSLESTTQFECPRKSFAVLIGLFPLAIAIEIIAAASSGIILSSAPSFFISCTGRQNYLPVFLGPSVILGFCIISYEEFQSCLLTPFKGVTLVLKPYIVL